MIRKSYAALRNFVTSLSNPNPDPNPNPMLSGQVESESESEKTGSDPHHCLCLEPTDSLKRVPYAFVSSMVNKPVCTLCAKCKTCFV